MLDTLLSIIAPHHCSGCSESGTLLCQNCKYDIISEPYLLCLACGKAIAGKQGLCGDCDVPYERAWCVAPRGDTLQTLLDDFKFANKRAAYKPLASLLDERLSELPSNVCIVPIPTVSSHIRQRGYNHTLLIARQFARLRNRQMSPILQRVTATMQRGANKRQRTKQAIGAFRSRSCDPDVIYILVDDVVTTGATMRFAAKSLVDAGARTVWAASISRQPLD